MLKTVEMDFQYQPVIPRPPASPKDLYKQACSSDEITVNTWRDIWLRQVKANHKTYGPFHKRGIGQLYQKLLHKPCIVAGSGPSLKTNVKELANRKGLPLISCLHNYQFFEDNGVTPDYYVTLDAGAVTIEEVSEGGKKTPEEYWESTKDKKLVAFIGSHPELLAKWKGEIYFYAAPIPDQALMDEIHALEPFHSYVSSGGNVLGASFYLAKAIMGANPIVFVGADFSFAYNNKFHAWDSKYDLNLGQVVLATDVFGMRVKTWQSYFNFKCWFESRCCSVPGQYINATEGGILGSYPDGNIEQIKQMALSDVIRMYSLSEEIEGQMKAPETKDLRILF
jgi:hypothetical protein